MPTLQRSVLVAIATLGVLACGDSETRPAGEEGETSGVETQGPETGEEEDSSTTQGTTTTDPSTTGTTDDGEPKFDLPPIPDLGGDCGGDGDGQSFSYIWIANSTQGTISKIETVSTIEEGRFAVTDNAAQQPSRTSVNQYGDVAAGHRFSPRVTKVAARMENCIDKNNNGMIDTSTGPNDILPYPTDECLLWTTDLPAHAQGTRAVAWEGGQIDPDTCENTIPNPRLWVGYGQSPLSIYRLDGDTGMPLDSVQVASAGFVYGGAVNADGDFWVSDRAGLQLHRIDGEDLTTQSFAVPGSQAYGVGMDQYGDPWIATYTVGIGDHVYRFDADMQIFVDAGGTSGRYRGMAIDREDRAWIAGNSPCRLALFDAATDTELDDAIPLPGCINPVGVSIDRDGYVWVVDQGAGQAWKVDPNFQIIVGMVTGLIAPYTYSDMTGQGLNLVVNPPG